MSKLAVNIGLAFFAGFITTLGAFVAKTGDAPPTKAVAFAALAAAVYAGVRGVVGYLLARYGNPVPTDV